jgi:predicted N-acetyltransferase YhbS
MNEVAINGHKYVFIKDYKDNEIYRKGYNALAQKTYGFDFEAWYKSGYWGSTYKQYSLMDGENLVANVSVSIIDYLVLNERKRCIQLGAVMTDIDYRKQGLSKFLIEKVIEEWKDKCGMIYLFANDGVLNFYPKFGFTAAAEYQHSKEITYNNEVSAAEKLDMSLESNRELLVEKIKHSIPVSRLAMLRNVGLIMFYCTSFMSDNVYYLREQDMLVIAEISGDTLYLQDIISEAEVDLDTAISCLANRDIKRVILGFTPKAAEDYCEELLKEEDTTLFILKGKEVLFQANRLRFPALSHA